MGKMQIRFNGNYLLPISKTEKCTQLKLTMYTISKKHTTKYFKIYLVKCLIYFYKLTLPSVSGGWSGENFLG